MDNPKQHGVRFDATINLGHIITFVGFLLAGFGAWSTLDKRVIILEENRKLQSNVDAAQDLRLAQASDQITSAILRLERQTERIADKLDNSISGRGRGNFPEPKP
jgi:hypothetical protein